MYKKFNDSEYVKGTIPTDAIRNQQHFVMKWDKGYPTTSNDATTMFKPGYKQQAEADSFIAEVTEDSVIFDNSRFMPLDTVEFDFSFLDAEANFYSMRDLTGASAGNQVAPFDSPNVSENVPTFKRSSLYCKPLVSYSTTPWLMVQENLEGDRFLQSFQSQVTERLKFNLELISLYGVNDPTKGKQGINIIDGMFKQLKDQYDNAYKTNYQTNVRTPQGVYCGINGGDFTAKDPVKIDFTKTLATDGTDAVVQLEDMLTQFGVQKGNRSKAKFYMSNEAYAKLIQIAQKRETQMADALYFEGGELKIWNTPVVVCDAFDYKVNEFGNNILLADLDSFVIGMKRDVETQSEFNLRNQAYDTVTRVYFDNLVLRPKDLLYAECSGLPSQATVPAGGSSSSSGSSSTGGSDKT
ncbi:phage major capsid protein [Methanosphaera cuniculi]|uniref:Phage capsid family protein n=1 Tax=Methanosphaera cuniculi TaxID=1077256 RepID=A0A2A2HF55_9EURY|nr:phage major capsid protein [Methanosphaera cuniculi]PAV08101.1 hypothetical protein ASJ82_01150 [Methanosphaera cuniculi]PWL07736.1 hypothetical protein MSCUN_12670 [Methanosphaera cuniculi]